MLKLSSVSGILFMALLLAGCGSTSTNSNARETSIASDTTSTAGTVSASPFGDAEIDQLAGLAEVPRSKVDQVQTSEDGQVVVYVSADQLSLFFSAEEAFCTDRQYFVSDVGSDIEIVSEIIPDEPSDALCAAGSRQELVTVTLDEPLGDRGVLLR